MLGPSWIALLRRVPATHHDALAVVMTSGIEIALQAVLRLERDFVVVRGRTTGSMDSGRILILPFDQMHYLAFNKALGEAEIKALLGSPGSLSAAVEATPVAVAVPAAVAAEAMDLAALNEQLAAVGAEAQPAITASEPETPPEALPANPKANSSAPISKSILLARLRARLARDGSRSQR